MYVTCRSDGLQPHYVNIQFLRKTAVEASKSPSPVPTKKSCSSIFIQTISLYLDYKQDESYTPSKVAVRAGSTFNDLAVCHIHKHTK
jgi:anaphase-promoting complex subunit 10